MSIVFRILDVPKRYLDKVARRVLNVPVSPISRGIKITAEDFEQLEVSSE